MGRRSHEAYCLVLLFCSELSIAVVAVLLPQRINVGPAARLPKGLLFVLAIPQPRVDPDHGAGAEPALEPLEEVGRPLVAVVPRAVPPPALPVRRVVPAPEPDVVGDALDQPAGARAPRVPLPAVHHLVAHDADDLVAHAARRRDAAHVVRRHVDLLVLVVELRAARVRDAGEGAQHQRHGAHGPGRVGGGRVGVEQVQGLVHGGGEERGEVDLGEEGLGAVAGQVAHLEAQQRERAARIVRLADRVTMAAAGGDPAGGGSFRPAKVNINPVAGICTNMVGLAAA